MSNEIICLTVGLPTVNVPVLSKTIVPAFWIFSICRPPLTIIPFFASLLFYAKSAIGVPTASPHAPATTITDRVDTMFGVAIKVITESPIANCINLVAILSLNF